MKRSVVHGSFTIERTYQAPPAKVFAAFANKEAKLKWFHGPVEWGTPKHDMDFRVGGRETSMGGHANSETFTFSCVYHDIVANERIVYAYHMLKNDTPISVSLATIELEPAGSGTRLRITEHGAFLDGYDDNGSRERGTKGLLEQLGASL